MKRDTYPFRHPYLDRARQTRPDLTSLQPDRLNHDIFGREVVAIDGNATDGVEHLQPLGHLAKDGVLAVQLRHRLKADEELAAVGGAGGIDGVGEARGRDGSLLEFESNLGGRGVAGASRAGAIGVPDIHARFLQEAVHQPLAALGIPGLHKLVGEEAVKSHSVVEMAVHQMLEAGNGLRCGGIVQLDDDTLGLLLLADLDQYDGRPRTCSGVTLRGGASCERKNRQENQGKQGSDIHELMDCVMLSGVFPPVKGSRAKRGSPPSAADRLR